jgi:hypothetical protein
MSTGGRLRAEGYGDENTSHPVIMEVIPEVGVEKLDEWGIDPAFIRNWGKHEQ